MAAVRRTVVLLAGVRFVDFGQCGDKVIRLPIMVLSSGPIIWDHPASSGGTVAADTDAGRRPGAAVTAARAPDTRVGPGLVHSDKKKLTTGQPWLTPELPRGRSVHLEPAGGEDPAADPTDFGVGGGVTLEGVGEVWCTPLVHAHVVEGHGLHAFDDVGDVLHAPRVPVRPGTPGRSVPRRVYRSVRTGHRRRWSATSGSGHPSVAFRPGNHVLEAFQGDDGGQWGPWSVFSSGGSMQPPQSRTGARL